MSELQPLWERPLDRKGFVAGTAALIAAAGLGRIEQLARPQEIYDAPATPFVASFIGETNFIDGRDGQAAVRPERIRVTRSGEGLPGELLASMVIGPALQVVVKLDDGQEVLVREQRSGRGSEVETLAAGERVMVSWAEDEALQIEGGHRE